MYYSMLSMARVRLGSGTYRVVPGKPAYHGSRFQMHGDMPVLPELQRRSGSPGPPGHLRLLDTTWHWHRILLPGPNLHRDSLAQWQQRKFTSQLEVQCSACGLRYFGKNSVGLP